MRSSICTSTEIQTKRQKLKMTDNPVAEHVYRYTTENKYRKKNINESIGF